MNDQLNSHLGGTRTRVADVSHLRTFLPCGHHRLNTNVHKIPKETTFSQTKETIRSPHAQNPQAVGRSEVERIVDEVESIIPIFFEG